MAYWSSHSRKRCKFLAHEPQKSLKGGVFWARGPQNGHVGAPWGLVTQAPSLKSLAFLRFLRHFAARLDLSTSAQFANILLIYRAVKVSKNSAWSLK